MNTKYKALGILAVVLFITSAIVSIIWEGHPVCGPLLILGFVFSAIAVRGFPLLKGFSYSLWIFTAVAVSLYYPEYFIGINHFEFKKLIIPLLQIIMFGMGSQMSLDDFAGVIKMPKGVLVGVICQFSIMPIIGVSIATLFNFPPEIAAGIILVGSSPSGLASNVMSFLARANLALSVTLTAVATLLSPLLTPLLMKLLAGQFVEIDFWSMMQGILNMVILPILAGLLFNVFSQKRIRLASIIQFLICLLVIAVKDVFLAKAGNGQVSNIAQNILTDIFLFAVLPAILAFVFRVYGKGNREWLNKALSFISMLGIAIIITIITAAGRDSLLEVGILLIFACLLHNLSGYALGYGICRLLRMDERDCRTIALEVGMQNGGLASGLALQMGKVATVGLAPAVFGPLMNITGSSLATWWRGRLCTNQNR